MSKFNDILKAAKEREEGSSELEGKDEPPDQSPASQSETQPPKRGRPKGKRSDPDFEQVTAYIRKETYRQTKITLLSSDGEQDFSELIESLLTEWLSTQKSKNPDT
jgi:hypothetical protein